MGDSLFDFGNVAQLAQGNLRNAMQMQHLDLQGRQTAVNEQQLAVNQQNARLNSIRAIWQDPRVVHDQELSDQLFGAIAPMVGIPTDGLQEKLTQSHKDRQELMTATLGQDPQKAQAAVIKLMAGMEPDKAAVFLKNIESVPALHARAQLAKQQMDMNEAKFAELRQNQAIVNEGRGPLTALSSTLRAQISGLDTPQFKAMQVIYKQTGKQGSLLESSDKTFSPKSKEPLQHLLDGNSSQLAENLQPEIMRWQHQLDTANRALIDMDHGITQPGQMKEQLTARIATAQPILGALRDMQEFYKDPLNGEKAELAKHAYKTIEGRRVELEAMDKKLDVTRQSLANLANEKFDYKQNVDSAKAEGQRRWLELPDGKRNPAAAGKISRQIKEELGVDVLPEDIYKNPDKPLVDLKVNTSQTASEEASKDFMKETRQTYHQLKQAPTLLNNIEKAKALVPLAKGFMGPGGEGLLEAAKFFNNRLGAKIDVTGVKSAEELRTRIFFNVMDSLKKLDSQPSQMQQQRLEDALGKLGTDPTAVPEILDAFGDVIREKIDIHNSEVAGAKKNGIVFPYDPTIAVPKKAGSLQGKAQPKSGGVSPSPGESGIANIKSDAEFSKLPSGAIFIGPDGKKRRKP